MRARYLFAVLLVACAGCATFGGGPALTAPDFANVVPGRTKDEVRAMIGIPARVHQLRTESGETWEYPYYGNYERRIFYVQFSPDGRVAKTEETPDFYSGKYKGW